MNVKFFDENIALGHKLEEERVLPLGITERALARAYTRDVRRRERVLKEKASELTDQNIAKLKEINKLDRERLIDLGNVEPLSDDEAITLLKGVIEDEKWRLGE